MKNKPVHSCRFVHHAKFPCIMTTCIWKGGLEKSPYLVLKSEKLSWLWWVWFTFDYLRCSKELQCQKRKNHFSKSFSHFEIIKLGLLIFLTNWAVKLGKSVPVFLSIFVTTNWFFLQKNIVLTSIQPYFIMSANVSPNSKSWLLKRFYQ